MTPLQGVAPFAYQGFDVLSWIPDGIEGREGDWTTPLERVDVPSGGFAVIAPATHPSHGIKGIYRCFSRAEHLLLWTWLAARLGRYAPFWCPSFTRDLDILDASSVGTWLVRFAGFAALLAADPSAKYLYGFTPGGAHGVAVMVTGAVDNGDGTETIAYSTNVLFIASDAVAAVIATTAVAACVLRFARLDTDTIAQQWSNTAGIVDIPVSIISITAEQP